MLSARVPITPKLAEVADVLKLAGPTGREGSLGPHG
jgi:hypothetical protein